MASHILSEFEPHSLFDHFYNLTRIPRPSHKEEGVRRFLKGIAEGAGARYEEDSTGNVLVRVPATKGCEKWNTMMTQGHMDMVCEKKPTSSHDFDKDPIALRIKDGKVFATDTTLGSDNGIGVCASLALMTDPSVKHGPLELIFTIDEESGMTGVKGLNFKNFGSKYLLNLDSEEPGTLTLGCAGGGDLNSIVQLTRTAPQKPLTLKVTVGGLRGGHSGTQIHEGRVNAIKFLAETLSLSGDFELYELQGGNLRNAIPRDAFAVIGLTEDQKTNLDGLIKKRLPELMAIESQASLLVESTRPVLRPIAHDQAMKIMRCIQETQSGVLEWSQELKDVVKTSNNLGVIKTEEKSMTLINLSRSFVTSEVRVNLKKISQLYEESGFTSTIGAEYPGWTPDYKSPLLRISQEVHRQVFRKEAQLIVIHAGLECGILQGKLPNTQMISFGPMIYDAHSPNEHLEIASVKPFWNYLVALVKELGTS